MAFGYNPTYGTPAPYMNAYQQPTYSAGTGQYAPQLYTTRPAEPVQQTVPPGMINARYVTGREEAIAAQILPDGNIWVFADISHGKIYTKQINAQTGGADFREYSAQQTAQTAREQPEPTPTSQYVTAEEFAALRAEVENLKTAVPVSTKRQAKEGDAK